VKAALVNCAPWSVLNISGLPCRFNASSRQSVQKDVSMLLLVVDPWVKTVGGMKKVGILFGKYRRPLLS
jgi:hypothetical protein